MSPNQYADRENMQLKSFVKEAWNCQNELLQQKRCESHKKLYRGIAGTSEQIEQLQMEAKNLKTAAAADNKDDITVTKQQHLESQASIRRTKDTANEQRKQYLIRDLQQCMDGNIDQYWVESRLSTSCHETFTKSCCNDIVYNGHLSAADNTTEKWSEDIELPEKGDDEKTEKNQDVAQAMEVDGENVCVEESSVEITKRKSTKRTHRERAVHSGRSKNIGKTSRKVEPSVTQERFPAVILSGRPLDLLQRFPCNAISTIGDAGRINPSNIVALRHLSSKSVNYSAAWKQLLCHMSCFVSLESTICFSDTWLNKILLSTIKWFWETPSSNGSDQRGHETFSGGSGGASAGKQSSSPGSDNFQAGAPPHGGGCGGNGGDGGGDRWTREKFESSMNDKRREEEEEKMKKKKALEDGVLDWLRSNEPVGRLDGEQMLLLSHHLAVILQCEASPDHDDCKINEDIVRQLKHCCSCLLEEDKCHDCARVLLMMYEFTSRYSSVHELRDIHRKSSLDEVRRSLLSVLAGAAAGRTDGGDYAGVSGDDEDVTDEEGYHCRSRFYDIECSCLDDDSDNESIVISSIKSPSNHAPGIITSSPKILVHTEGAPGQPLPELQPRGLNGREEPLPRRPQNVFTEQLGLPAAHALGCGNLPQFSSIRQCRSEELQHPNPLPIDDRLQSTPDRSRRPHGSVHYGTPAQLSKLANLWGSYAEAGSNTSVDQRSPIQGIILEQARSILCMVDGHYEEEHEWWTVSDYLGSKDGCDQGNYLGAGTSGQCFACIDAHSSQRFCVKKIYVQTFNANELLVWLKLEHEFVVGLFGAVLVDEHVYIFQELIIGPTLKEYIGKTVITSYEALDLLQQLLNVLKYLKYNNVIHNDLKADNMMLREESQKLVLIDFGLSTNAAFVPSNVNPVGSQTHWSPEKASSAGYDFSADLWAAICVFVHILSGTEPWLSRFGDSGLLHFVIHSRSPPIEDVPEGLPVEIQNLIKSGWTVNPQDRPSVEQLLNHSAFSLLENASPDDYQFRQHWPVVTSASDGESPAVVDETGSVTQAEEEDDPDEYNLNDGEQLLAEFHLSLGHFRDGRGGTVGTSEELEPARQFTGTQETVFFSSEQQNLAEMQDVGQEQDIEQDEEQAAQQDEHLPCELEHLHRAIEPDDGEHMNSPRSNDVFDVTGSCESAREDSIIVVDLNKLIMEPSEKGPALRVDPAVLEQLNARHERRRSAVSVNNNKVDDRTRSHDVTAAEDVAANAVEPCSVNSSRNVCQRSTEEREEHDSGNRIPLPVLPVFDETVSDNESGGDGDLSAKAAGQPDNETTPMMLEENPNQARDASCPADRSYLGSLNSLMSSSLGTVVTMYYNENRVYSLNLLPGRQVLWADVMKRAASSKIKELELSEFTAVMADDSAINVNDYVPSEQSIQVIIQPVSDDYAWKIDESGEIYIPPGYRGPFRSHFNDD